MTGTPCGSQYSTWMSSEGSRWTLADVDAVVHHGHLDGGNAVVHEDVANGAGRGDEPRHLAVLPAGERVAAQMKIHAARGHQRRRRRDTHRTRGGRRHRHGVRIVRVHDVGPVVAETRDSLHAAARSISLRGARPTRSTSFGRARVQLTLRMRDEHRPVPALAQSEDGQERLLLSASPGAGGVDVEAEHSSQSLANLRPT